MRHLHRTDLEVYAESWSFPRALMAQYAHLGVFVETGTYQGGGVKQALDLGFRAVYSCEIDADLFNLAGERFAGDDRVDVYCGDAADLLPGILAELTAPALIFLDGHDPDLPCPLLAELQAIAAAGIRDHVIVVDDVDTVERGAHWGGTVTVDAIAAALLKINPAYQLRRENGKTRPGSMLFAELGAAADRAA